MKMHQKYMTRQEYVNRTQKVTTKIVEKVPKAKPQQRNKISQIRACKKRKASGHCIKIPNLPS